MRNQLLDYIYSPKCYGNLELYRTINESNGNILSGILRCTSCKSLYGIRGGIPVLYVDECFKLSNIAQMTFYNMYAKLYDTLEAKLAYLGSFSEDMLRRENYIFPRDRI